MKFEGIVLKLQNLYVSSDGTPETKCWQITLELSETAIEEVKQFRDNFVGTECNVRVFSKGKESEFTAQAYEGTVKNTSKGTTNKIYLRLPASPVGEETFKELIQFANEPCRFEIT